MKQIKQNKELRAYALEKDIALYEIAEALGIARTSLSRKLRKELKPCEKYGILKIIDEIAERKTA